MSDPAQMLRDFTPSREYFVGIDSDGCVFDSMEIKPKGHDFNLASQEILLRHMNLTGG